MYVHQYPPTRRTLTTLICIFHIRQLTPLAIRPVSVTLSPKVRPFSQSATNVMTMLETVLITVTIARNEDGTLGLEVTPENTIGARTTQQALKVGDRIVSVDGEQITASKHTVNVLATKDRGPYQFTVERKKNTIQESIAERPGEEEGQEAGDHSSDEGDYSSHHHVREFDIDDDRQPSLPRATLADEAEEVSTFRVGVPDGALPGTRPVTYLSLACHRPTRPHAQSLAGNLHRESHSPRVKPNPFSPYKKRHLHYQVPQCS